MRQETIRNLRTIARMDQVDARMRDNRIRMDRLVEQMEK